MHLLFPVVEDKDDSCSDEDGDKADRQTEDPVVGDSDVEMQGGECSAPNHHIQHLVEGEGRFKLSTWMPKASILSDVWQ